MRCVSLGVGCWGVVKEGTHLYNIELTALTYIMLIGINISDI